MSQEKIHITLPDGTVKAYSKGVSGMDIALSISEGLARNVLAARVDGEVWDVNRAIEEDANVQLLTWNDQDGKSAFWHSSAHLMAEALEALYPGIKFGIVGDNRQISHKLQKFRKNGLNRRFILHHFISYMVNFSCTFGYGDLRINQAIKG